MNFISLASSSHGNAYLLKVAGAGSLLLEAGLPISVIRNKLRAHGVMLSDLAGCLISHEHGDHAKAVKDLLKSGLDCYMSFGTAEALGVKNHHRTHSLYDNPNTWSILGGWTVSTFPLHHDAKDPTGFLIDHGNDRLLFVPDTAFVKDRFESVTIACIECNNIEEILINNVLGGHIPAIVGRRICRSHMSLETLVVMLKASDLSKCRAIYLLHLSNANSSEELMKSKIQAETGIPTYICEEN